MRYDHNCPSSETKERVFLNFIFAILLNILELASFYLYPILRLGSNLVFKCKRTFPFNTLVRLGVEVIGIILILELKSSVILP